jgi:hypothetical protein
LQALVDVHTYEQAQAERQDADHQQTCAIHTISSNCMTACIELQADLRTIESNWRRLRKRC